VKIRVLGAEFHADRRTDMAKLIVDFGGFAKAPKNGSPERPGSGDLHTPALYVFIVIFPELALRHGDSALLT
jgi:hypothetical protein